MNAARYFVPQDDYCRPKRRRTALSSNSPCPVSNAAVSSWTWLVSLIRMRINRFDTSPLIPLPVRGGEEIRVPPVVPGARITAGGPG